MASSTRVVTDLQQLPELDPIPSAHERGLVDCKLTCGPETCMHTCGKLSCGYTTGKPEAAHGGE